MIYHSCGNNHAQGMGFCSLERRRPPQCCCNFCCQPVHRPYPPIQPPFYPPATSTPSILTAANGADTTVAAGALLPFAFNSLAYGNDISHNPGTSTVSINTPGIYLVHFQGTATPLTTAAAESSITTALTLNGAAVPGASATAFYTTATDANTLNFTTAIAVTSAPATLSVTLPDDGAIFTDSALTVYRLASIPAPTAVPYNPLYPNNSTGVTPTYPGTTVPIVQPFSTL